MRAVIRSGLVALALVPAALTAQSGASAGNHELGFDLTFVHGKPDGGESSWAMGAPVDIRIGFVRDRRMMFETAFSFQAGGNDAAKSFDGGLGLSALFAKSHRSGPFLRANFGLAISAVTDEPTGIAPSLGAGIGTRLPRGSAAIRLEAFGRYVFESSNDAPSAVRVGVRAGFSFWH